MTNLTSSVVFEILSFKQKQTYYFYIIGCVYVCVAKDFLTAELIWFFNCEPSHLEELYNYFWGEIALYYT